MAKVRSSSRRSAKVGTLLGLVAPTLVALAGCSHPGDTAEKGASSTSTQATPSAPASPGPVASAASGHASGRAADEDSDEPAAPPAEKFTDGPRAFESVKKTLLNDYYATGITEDDVYRAAVQGMLEHVDPKMSKWNKLLSPAEVAEIRDDLKGELIGIGVKINFDPSTGHIEVQGTAAGSPAQRAGILQGDLIVSVNGRLYKGKTERDVVADIRGKAGEPVKLSILREDKLLALEVKRDVVQMEEVTHATFDAGGVGYVRIHGFSSKTPPMLRAALEDLASKPPRGLVLDLRQNKGGSFDEAIASAELLLPAGTPIVRILGRSGKEESFTAKGQPILPALPLVVLVDHETSSGAEFVTAALQEGRRARVVGGRTYGKWSVQMISDLPNGYAYKFTSALFQSPSGKSFGGVGLGPDVEVDMDRDQVEKSQAQSDAARRLAMDVQLRTAIALLAK
jgi:carboxyl-terminal processing protease